MLLLRQVNLNKSPKAQEHICSLMVESDNCIYLLQEPNWSKQKVFTGLPKGFKILGTPNSRAIIVAPKHFPVFTVQELTCKDHTLCLYDDGDQKRFFGSIYLDILLPSVSEPLSKICDYVTLSGSGGILCLDSNAHSVLWGSLVSNPRGEALEELIFQHNIDVLNKGSKPTFVNLRGHNV